MNLSRKTAYLTTQLSGLEILVTDLQQELMNTSKTVNDKLSIAADWQVEQEQVSGQLTHRTNALKDSIATLQAELAEFVQQQPEDKLYSRAQKMVKLGADVDELMTECQLPRIEAEMLIAMHKKNNKPTS
ncbi:DUF2802 domain-containing protein [Thalassotalea sp. 1_MG-2023]|uniref:DUF2802 domain-containing protein n=1 Tax=Thalassotalea sp. 1_MG-2023 TaxID=3062680 RepID=UPI0026E2D774|nr:DUF2802 domain-containing protein [Thalassotalea sp. 1_MG-2023]MDO6426489.1 DUF2802 domain-containing protein [Thalassotalea sp. 1_MG-2023]